MIHLIAGKDSKNFESLKKYFLVKRFYDFKEYKSYLEQNNHPEFIKPLAIISEEIIERDSIYNILYSPNYPINFHDIPLLVTKNHLEGYEMNYINQGIVDDFVLTESNIDDLVERIRFFLMHKHDVNKNFSDEVTTKKRIPDYQLFIRRSIDLIFSIFISLLLSPVLLIVAILIKLESHGPVFYVSYRAGEGYNIFKIYKFRTMVDEADKMLNDYLDLNQYNDSTRNQNSTFVKLNNDPRITRIGSFLRKSSLDELPQLINVIKGEMSLIGNRPLPLYEAVQLTRDCQSLRFNAPAGITGLWQIRKRGKADMSVEERINLDVEYALNYNLKTDLKIFFQTFPALIQDAAV